jgi:hypothetical protein
MTINLLTAVEDDGLVMCTDSMLTLTSQNTAGTQITTTYENADKLIDLGNLPAAAMISGSGDIGGRLVSALLRQVSRSIDSQPRYHSPTGVVDAVADVITPAFNAMVAQVKVDAAAYYSQLDQLGKINEEREKNKLPPLDTIAPEQIGIEGELDGPEDPVHRIKLVPITIVVGSYFTDPSGIEIRWPGARRQVYVPGNPLAWWGSGGSAVARVVRGFDLDTIAAHIAAKADPGSSDAEKVLEYARTWEREYGMPAPISQMPLQDAVAFTEYLGQVACGYDKFKVGQPGVGGDLDLLVLRPGTREWVYRKRIHSTVALR